ncbi:hypothetical protein BP00DRAFT_424854 [Aspergillus indologenus CBS 114.80]|uniref:Uncharacterized protein n=1 Tax=Aspergillus indologenus CBS 114.80 TaxID=1450541 RepID=A0A2V5IUV9_9EURO|nr:hypothetical protein BP00DRAFT_424854 [Aspergillus indologenus CBS 114.80]
MSARSSLEVKLLEKPRHVSTRTRSNLKSRLREHWELWKVGLAAKEHWDDEYNFPPGRYYGQSHP